MNFITLLFGAPSDKTGERDRLPVLSSVPSDAIWRKVKPRADHVLARAQLADHDGVLTTPYGPMTYRQGVDYLVSYGLHDRAVVKRAAFEKTYQHVGEDVYSKRADLVLRYFTLAFDTAVMTNEGKEIAHSGDWIVEGVEGDLYPIAKKRAQTLYEAVDG